MEVKVYSELGGCPEECPHLDMTVEEANVSGSRALFVDCRHSEACAMWDESIGGECRPCKTSSASSSGE